MVNLNYGGWVKVARTLASNASLSIRYVGDEDIKKVGAQAWTDSRFIYLRKPDHTWNDKQFRLWLYFLIHEIGHNTVSRAGCWTIMKEKQPDGLLRYVLNIIEDHIQERELHRDQPILRGYLGSGRAAFIDYMQGTRTDETVEQMKDNPQGPCLFAWDNSHRVDFMPEVRGYEHVLIQPVIKDAQVIEWTAKLQAGDYADLIKASPDPAETFEIAERIVREVFGEDPAEQQKQQDGGKGDEQGEGEGEEVEGEGQSSGEGDEGTTDESEDGKPSKKRGRFDYHDLLSHDHQGDKRGSKTTDERSGGCDIDYDSYFETEGKTWSEFVPNLETAEEYDVTRGTYPDRDNRYCNPAVPPSQLSKRIGRYMQANSRNKRLHGQKSGALSGKNLFRMRVPGASQESRQKVFNRKVINKSKDVAVTVLIDMSGSMDGEKAHHAIAAVTHLHSVIHQALRIPLEILGFSESWGKRGGDVGRHVIVQSFDRPRHNSQVEEDMRRVLPFQGANRDGEALMWAYKRLLARQASRHIMIVLSDGQPRSSEGDVAGFTREVSQQIDKAGLVELHGIGIQSDSVRHFYKSYDVINDVTELEPKLLGVLKNKIIKHL